MNCAAEPFTQDCPFQQPTSLTPDEVAESTTTRTIVTNNGHKEERKLIEHIFPPTLSLQGVKGGRTTADLFALVTLAQLIVLRNLKFHMPSLHRRGNRKAVTWALGPHAHTTTRWDFTERHSLSTPTNSDKANYAEIARACRDAFDQGIHQWQRAVHERISRFSVTPQNDGLLSMCFSISEADPFLNDITSLSDVGHYTCDAVGEPQLKLRSALREVLQWFTTNLQVNGKPTRIFFLLQMKHRVVLLVFDAEQQSLAVIDPQPLIRTDNPSPAQQNKPHPIRTLQPNDVPSGMRVAVACVGNVSMMCNYICNVLFNEYGGAAETTTICFDRFVVDFNTTTEENC